jgi:hypothetical protein
MKNILYDHIMRKSKLGNYCYYSIQIILAPSLLYKTLDYVLFFF